MDFSKRMFRYYYRIFDKYNQDIVAIALLTDDSTHFRPDSYVRASYGTVLTYEFNMFKLMDYNEQELLQSNNPFAIALLAAKYANEAKHDDEKRYYFKLKLMRYALQNKIYPHEERRIYLSALIYFIDYLLHIPIELTKKLRNEMIFTKEGAALMYLDRKNPPPTFEEVMKVEREEAINLEKKKIALKLIQENFSDEYISELTELGIEEVKALKEN